MKFVSANCAADFQNQLFDFVIFFSLKAVGNKSEQGESNAEGMGCTHM